jgi:hypothetical protein
VLERAAAADAAALDLRADDAARRKLFSCKVGSACRHGDVEGVHNARPKVIVSAKAEGRSC